MRTILIGTGNRGKTAEIRSMLAGLEIEVLDLSDFEDIEAPVEDGSSFEENAEIKARAYSRATGYWTVADDSGLEVVALGNRPGIFSARFAGKNASDRANNLKLLKKIAITGTVDRSARFVCAICLADPNGRIVFSNTSFCDGEIALKPCGFNGFGYDPVFVPRGLTKTFGELPEKVKKSISHRSLATAKLAEFLASNSGVLT